MTFGLKGKRDYYLYCYFFPWFIALKRKTTVNSVCSSQTFKVDVGGLAFRSSPSLSTNSITAISAESPLRCFACMKRRRKTTIALDVLLINAII
jgi:hypothetical protein